MSTATKAVHTPGDVNHKFLAAAGYDFCATCGSSLRGKRTVLETEMLEALQLAVKDCACTLREKDSGHLIDCFAPTCLALIQKAKGGQ